MSVYLVHPGYIEGVSSLVLFNVLLASRLFGYITKGAYVGIID